MTRVRLKKLLKNNLAICDLIERLGDELGQQVSIVGTKGEVIFGVQPKPNIEGRKLVFQEHSYGCLYAGIANPIIAPVLISLIQKEYDKRKLGSEVLDLYREINLIHKFAQMLSATIDQKEIARLTLSEIRQLLNANAGGIIYHSDHRQDLQVLYPSP